MAKLSAEQIANVAISAGVPREKVALSVAIALAESGGNPAAHNRVPPDNSYGLWQINMLGALGPDRRKKLGLSRDDQLFDPATNARAMMMISSNGTNWRPWTTYTSGAYLTRMAEANFGASRATGDTTGINVVPNVPSFDNLKKAIETLTLPGTWVRLGMLVGGFILLMVGVAKLTGDNQLSPLTKKAVAFAVTRKVTK